MSDWQTLSSEIVYETKWFKIHRDEVLNHRGKELTYSYMELPHPTVTIVAMNDQQQILLQRHFRYTIQKTIWELPSGHSDGQEPLMAAQRELMEETGLASDNWHLLGMNYSAIGIANIARFAYIAQAVKPADGERDDDEAIFTQTFFSFEDIEKMIINGDIQSSGVIAALYMAKLHLQKEEA